MRKKYFLFLILIISMFLLTGCSEYSFKFKSYPSSITVLRNSWGNSSDKEYESLTVDDQENIKMIIDGLNKIKFRQIKGPLQNTSGINYEIYWPGQKRMIISNSYIIFVGEDRLYEVTSGNIHFFYNLDYVQKTYDNLFNTFPQNLTVYKDYPTIDGNLYQSTTIYNSSQINTIFEAMNNFVYVREKGMDESYYQFVLKWQNHDVYFNDDFFKFNGITYKIISGNLNFLDNIDFNDAYKLYISECPQLITIQKVGEIPEGFSEYQYELLTISTDEEKRDFVNNLNNLSFIATQEQFSTNAIKKFIVTINDLVISFYDEGKIQINNNMAIYELVNDDIFFIEKLEFVEKP